MSAIPFKLIGRNRETPTVSTLRLVADAPGQFKFDPGAFGLVQVEGSGLPARAFSFSSSPDDAELEITVEKVGPLTRALHEIPIGSRLLVNGPQGKFLLPKEIDRDIVMIAGGTGIAPFRSMFRSLAQRPINRQANLFHSVRGSKDVLYQEEFRRLANSAPGLSYQVTITRPDGDWNGLTGRFTPGQLLEKMPNLIDCQVFLCGSPQFVLGLIRSLTEQGVPRDSILTEQWHQPDGA